MPDSPHRHTVYHCEYPCRAGFTQGQVWILQKWAHDMLAKYIQQFVNIVMPEPEIQPTHLKSAECTKIYKAMNTHGVTDVIEQHFPAILEELGLPSKDNGALFYAWAAKDIFCDSQGIYYMKWDTPDIQEALGVYQEQLPFHPLDDGKDLREKWMKHKRDNKIGHQAKGA